jgi:hypothetical protein
MTPVREKVSVFEVDEFIGLPINARSCERSPHTHWLFRNENTSDQTQSRVDQRLPPNYKTRATASAKYIGGHTLTRQSSLGKGPMQTNNLLKLMHKNKDMTTAINTLLAV